MTQTPRIILLAMTLLVAINLVAAQSAPSFSPEVGAEPESPSEQFSRARALVEPLDLEQRALVERALALFDDAGIEWSRPGIEFGGELDCLGFGGVYRISKDTVRICRPSIETLVHELAHGYIETTFDETDKQDFLVSRGLDEWVGGDDWDARGAEHAAEIITWAVLEEDITIPWIVEDSDGEMEWTTRLLKIPQSSPAELATAYEELTGNIALRRLADPPKGVPEYADAISPEALR